MARGRAQLVVAIVPLVATPPTVAADRLGVAIDEAERDDRGELRVGGLVDERGGALNARGPLERAGFAERERGVVSESAVDADPGGVDRGDRGLGADEQLRAGIGARGSRSSGRARRGAVAASSSHRSSSR